MSLNYEQIKSQLQSYKPKWESKKTQLEALTIPEDFPFKEFFNASQDIFLQGYEFGKIISEDPEFKSTPIELLQTLNADYFAPIKPEGYQRSLANPDYTVNLYGKDMGQLLSAIYTQYRNTRTYLLFDNYLQLDEDLHLFLTLYDLASSNNANFDDWKKVYLSARLANMYLKSALQNLLRLSPEVDLFRNIIETSDLTDLRYLFRYGNYISDNEFALADFMAQYPSEELDKLAKYIIQCWIDGFIRAKKDYSLKKYVNLVIPCGMERLGKLLIEELKRLNFIPLVTQPYTKGANRQYNYDHRFDIALLLDRSYVDESLKIAEDILEDLKDLIIDQAGPVYVELFGELPFTPEIKSSTIQLSPEQEQLYRELSSKNSFLYMKYYHPDETSFTIIAFPSPEIGPQFPEIFADTVKINTLDSHKYALIQQKIIDVLDNADAVYVKGKPGNETNIIVKLHPLSDSEHQTKFENCVADVNIPVGEVFTSPLLKGTNGTLFVEDIYLQNLRFFNLKIQFEDGWIKDYSCINFPDPEESKRYIYQNLLLPHQTLPLGEFAIGTNTTAYQMARKYNIISRLPILIIEKMGPHFAIGDTCFSHEEEAPHINFLNGKSMIAVENEKSATRKEDPINAYINKHIDITLPYEMLDSITAIGYDGTRTDIIKNGRFVLPGTEELNIPLDEGW